MKIILFTTTAMESAREEEVKRLFDSVAVAARALEAIDIDHYFLVQQCRHLDEITSRFSVPAGTFISGSDDMIPLSIARNRMIEQALEADVPDDALVMFPDDDAWYPAGTLEHIARQFAGRADLDLWFCRYGEQARFHGDVKEVVPGFQDVLSYASSNTIAVSGRALKQLGGFDERLGLGTPLRSGEDTDFAIRAYFAARKSGFVDARIIGHRDFNKAVRAKYYRGSLVAIARYARRSPVTAAAFVRKMAVGAMLYLKRELPARELMASWQSIIRPPNSGG